MAFSPDFLRRFAQLSAQSQQNAMIAGTADPVTSGQVRTNRTPIGNRQPHWNIAQGDVQVIVYDPYTGMAFPSPGHARAYGIGRFVYNLPAGMKVDWSYWDRFSQPEPTPDPEPTPPPVAEQEVAFNPAPASTNTFPTPSPAPARKPKPEPEPEPEPEPAPAPTQTKSVPSGPTKTFDAWSKRAKELGWSEGSSGRAAYQGYLNNRKAAGLDHAEPSVKKASSNAQDKPKTQPKDSSGPTPGSLEWRDLHGLTN